MSPTDHTSRNRPGEAKRKPITGRLLSILFCAILITTGCGESSGEKAQRARADRAERAWYSWEITGSIMAVGIVIAFVVGIALGSKAKNDAERSTNDR